MLWHKEKLPIMTKFLLLPQCFQLHSIIFLSFIRIYHVFAWLFSKSSAADLLYMGTDQYYGKLLKCFQSLLEVNDRLVQCSTFSSIMSVILLKLFLRCPKMKGRNSTVQLLKAYSDHYSLCIDGLLECMIRKITWENIHPRKFLD